MRLTSLRIKNYGCLADVEFQDIPPLAVFVGANGTGKSTLFDVFAFLRDALRDDVRVAIANRGGFEAVRTAGRAGPIRIELGIRYDRQDPDDEMAGHLSYTIAVEPDTDGLYVALERVELTATLAGGAVEMTVQRKRAAPDSKDQPTEVWIPPELSGPDRLWLDQPLSLVFVARQEGEIEVRSENDAIPDNHDELANLRPEVFEIIRFLEDVRTFLRGMHISNVDPSSAKVASDVARDHRLSERGENLANVLWHQHQGRQVDSLDRVQSSVRRAVPGFERVEPVETFDGRVGLRFVEASNNGSFNARHVSDGTVKFVAYALLLNESDRHPLLCVEEPENYLYPTLLGSLIEEFRYYTRQGDAQVLVATHSPDLLNATNPDEVFWLVKENGVTDVHRVSDDPQLVAEHEYGDQLGRMWRSGAFEGAHPNW